MSVMERGTLVVTADFRDEFGEPVIPNEITYSLYNTVGSVMNDLLNVDVTPLAASVNIVLTGDDLSVLGGNTGRLLVINAPYDSTSGTDLQNRIAYPFNITRIVGG